jgi:hypothetical protein
MDQKRSPKFYLLKNFPPIFCHLKSLKTQKKLHNLVLSLWKDTQRASESDCVAGSSCNTHGGGNGKLYEQQQHYTTLLGSMWSTSSSQEKLVPTSFM